MLLRLVTWLGANGTHVSWGRGEWSLDGVLWFLDGVLWFLWSLWLLTKDPIGLNIAFQKSQPEQPKKNVPIQLLASNKSEVNCTRSSSSPWHLYNVYTFTDMEHPCHIKLMTTPVMNSLFAFMITFLALTILIVYTGVKSSCATKC